MKTYGNVIVKSTILPQYDIYKYSWASAGKKTYKNHTDHMKDRREHSSVRDVRSCMGADRVSDTDHCGCNS